MNRQASNHRCTRDLRSWFFLCLVSITVQPVFAQISIPEDAPQPLSPSASAAAVNLPDGFSLELVAAEPLIRNPSGVCWDERGRLFVCELHGYNMEGQYDIEKLNQTGILDREVRRTPAPPEAIRQAERDQVGSVKRLIDSDGDGVMDKSEVWADNLPACFGLVPARGGVIVLCAPDIVFLADRDDDGVAEVREVLFTGFRTGALERRMSNPQWGFDNWIYAAGGGGKITGSNLKEPIELPRNDFRFKADGTAIEPLNAGTWTFGFTYSNSGDRYVISTGSPAIFVAPLPWRYLARNPHVGFGRMTVDVGPGQKTYPVSEPHPWRSRRAADPGFEELYRTRYGAEESAPNGFFTSACSPLVYKDTALPLEDQLLACEPAQNMIHRSIITRDGLIPALHRTDSEQRSEFLASSDIWFHPIAMSHAPDGSIVICDFYREIIEDYSAIPRYLQQQYQLKHGEQHGRLWRLVHRDSVKGQSQSDNMNQLSTAELIEEVTSPRFWRRQTAKRLLIERADTNVAQGLRDLVSKQGSAAEVITSLVTLEALGQLRTPELNSALTHPDPAVVVQAMRLADRRFTEPGLLDRMLTLVNERDERVLLQLALSLGESEDWRARQSLAILALHSLNVPWMDDALLSSLEQGSVDLLQAILRYSDTEQPSEELVKFVARLAQMIADRRGSEEISAALVSLDKYQNHDLFLACLSGMRASFAASREVHLSEQAQSTIRNALQHQDGEIAKLATELIVAMKIESEQEKSERLQRAANRVSDVRLSVADRVSAVRELAEAGDSNSIQFLFKRFDRSTPTVRVAILDSVLSRSDNLPVLLDAIETKRLPTSAMTAVQRESLLQADDPTIRQRAAKIFAADSSINTDLAKRFDGVTTKQGDPTRGQNTFKKLCSNCHRVGKLGFDVGPDLASEFSRSEQTFVQDILAPSAKITPGYETYLVQTDDGKILTGLIKAESPTSITLCGEAGKSQTILRQQIEAIKVSTASLMPEDLAKSLQPRDVADIISWLRGGH